MKTARAIVLAAVAFATIGATLPPVTYIDLATPFEQAALSTADQADATRIATVRDAVNRLLPGIYPADSGTDRRLAKALAAFPEKRAGFDRTVQDFPARLADAVARFRTIFPGFIAPIPIYLYHSTGLRDGGSDYLEPGHRLVMLFGADTIAEYHNDSSLEPFFDHELFHLEHGRSFPDCDQFWCVLWQEGLAVDAAAVMTPHATDHQLLLDMPSPIRAPTDMHWAEALCFVATHFDETSETAIGQAFKGGGHPPRLPERFGYYVGYRIAQAAGLTLPALARMDHETARPILRATVIRLMKAAKAHCAPPADSAAITHATPHPV